jgi:double-strand break repair protein MRE11
MDSLVGTFRILQPGSSIATSLGPSESSAHPKHAMFFEIKEKKFRMKALRLTQVRQFTYDEISLKDYTHLDANDPRIEDQIRAILTAKVSQMILEGRNDVQEVPQRDTIRPSRFCVKDPLKILVRLRVDHEGFPAINHQRFGSQFFREVANAVDVILLAKKRKEVLRAVERGVIGGAAAGRNNLAAAGGGLDLQQMFAEGGEDEIHKIRIDDLVSETLANNRKSLSLLVESDMAQVLLGAGLVKYTRLSNICNS